MESIEFTLFRAALAAYAVSGIAFVISTIFGNRMLDRLGSVLALAGAVLNGTSLVLRGLEAGHAPFTNLYETLSFFSFLLALGFLIVRRRVNIKTLGAYVMPLVFLAMVIGLVNYTEPGELMPALRSFWLSVHVPIAILSYALFALAFVGGILYLVRERSIGGSSVAHLEELRPYDIFAYRTIAAGFILLTMAIVTGAVWAEAAWGSYWSWDPKETWSLVTWMVYAFYMHARMVRGWTGKRSAAIAVAGFGAVLFTYFGVTYLLSGLHSYG